MASVKPAPHSQIASQFSRSHVSDHSTATDMWIIIGNDVYDVTKFQNEHPGGDKILQSFAGKDATKKFNKHHNPKLLERYKGELKVGEVIEDEDKDAKLISKMKLKFFKGKS